MFNITIGGDWNATLQRQIDVLSPSVLQSAMEAAGRAAGVTAESVVSPYPPQTGNALPLFYVRTSIVDGKQFMSKFKSLKQQRYVLALAARGGIPSRRTGTLGRSITSDIDSLTPVSVTVKIGTNVNYAPYVIDRYRQSHYHAGNWTPLQDDIDRGQAQISAAANSAFIGVIRAAF